MSKLTATDVAMSLAILSVRESVVAFGIRGGSSLLRVFPLFFSYMSSTDRMTFRSCSGGMYVPPLIIFPSLSRKAVVGQPPILYRRGFTCAVFHCSLFLSQS